MNAANGRFWTVDSYEGTTFDPISLHKFAYANADATNRTDPSGNKAFWQYVEESIGAVYVQDHPGDEIQFGRWARVGLVAALKPDIMNLTQKKWAEIKPFSFNGIARGALSYTTYLVSFEGTGYDPDTTWAPSTHLIFPNGTPTVFWNDEGLIYYTDAFQNAAEAVALIGIRQFWPLLRGVGGLVRSRVGEYAFARFGQTVAMKANEARAQSVQAQLALTPALSRL